MGRVISRNAHRISRLFVLLWLMLACCIAWQGTKPNGYLRYVPGITAPQPYPLDAVSVEILLVGAGLGCINWALNATGGMRVMRLMVTTTLAGGIAVLAALTAMHAPIHHVYFALIMMVMTALSSLAVVVMLSAGLLARRAKHGPTTARITRGLTAGEIALLASVYGQTIPYSLVKIHHHKAYFFQPDDTAMAPNGELYFPPAHALDDFSTATLSHQAWLVHEGAHLYQHHHLKWNVRLRGIFDRRYGYKLVPGQPFHAYGLEQQGEIARDYYRLQCGATIGRPHRLDDYAGLLPLTPMV